MTNKTPSLTHLDDEGRVQMVDVGAKPPLRRRAVAEGYLIANPDTVSRVLGGELPKGEALAAARLAGILAAKRTGDLIPLCHPLPLDHVGVQFEPAAPDRIRIVAEASIVARTGIEMEVLTAVSVAALTLYDMAKAIDTTMRIDGIVLLEKTKQPVA